MLFIKWVILRMCLSGTGFLLIRIFCELATYIKDDAYNFPVELVVIATVEKDKHCGKEEEYSTEHMTCVLL
jgi:hypothetical protein